MASKQQIKKFKASKYHMRALGTAAPIQTINIILHNNSYLPAVQWPKWQQMFTSPKWQANYKSTHHIIIVICRACNGPNGNKYVQAQMAQSVQAQMATNMYKPK